MNENLIEMLRAKYPGVEWVGSVPRHPAQEPIQHIGGW